ncbi:protein trafficking Pga2 [Coniochaeta sp. 2T2.1]|nr:protein trafficking Pga2 [Coniochaeta sp. 2T2.1]
MESFRGIATMLGDRITNNVKSGLTNMTPEKWIRIIILAGAYALLRPYIIKLGAKQQMKAHERQEAEDEAEAAKISPNMLRGQIDIPDDSDDEEDLAAGRTKKETTAAVTATEWGKKARRRQRDVIKKLLDAEEERLRQEHEDEEDKDIEEFLVPE